MTLFLYFIFFILGACIISFLKVIAYDYPQLSITRRSHCDHCNRILRWFEIIPILGYFIVHGKCIRCKMQIDFSNPFWEFIGGFFFTLIVYQHDWKYLPIFIMLVLLGFTDHFYGYIYPIFYLLSLPTLFLVKPLHWLPAVILYLTLFLLSKKFEFGLGDVEVISLLGLIFKFETVLQIIIVACSFCILSYLVNKKRSFRFIPYLACATGVIYLIFYLKLR